MTVSFAGLLLSTLSLWVAAEPDAVRQTARRWLAPEAPAAAIEWVRVPRGTHRPQFAPSSEESEIVVEELLVAKTPTTNADFLRFVRRHPEWRRDRVSRLFADDGYLAHWKAETELEVRLAKQPVTNVSWFAARAYCAAEGARLPTDAEWARVAAASPNRPDGREDPKWSKAILDWYAKPSRGPERDVGAGAPNFWGISDLHGLVWEWVLDFNSTLVTSDSRNTQSNDKTSFCGAGALAARDPEDYASFMRTAFLSSLGARNVARHLGFRCVRDTEKEAS
ncbi:MAG: formylglycine-generating enzyme family protein [Polyangiaceae bacterium]|nr:formylglycine-generating enzyme family protein [Polyangiaceae bacterium]